MIKKNNIYPSILIAVILLFTACSNNSEEKTQKKKDLQKVNVNVHTIKREPHPIWASFSGKTEAFKKVDVTSRVSGELKQIYFKAGQKVKKGELLFKIDDSQYKAILAQKIASLKKDQASLNLAKSNVKRYTPLVNEGLAPREKLDELIANQQQYQAIVDSGFATIQEAKLNVEYTNIRATINGQIGKNLVNVGNLINASSTILANVVDSKYLYVNFNPSSNEVALIKKYRSQENPDIKIQLEENGDIELKGYVDFVDNKTNESTGTVLVRAKTDNSKNLILPGTFVQIKLFITDKQPVLAIDPNSLGQNQLGAFVYVVNDQNMIETKQVETQFSTSEYVLLKSGVEENDKIVVSDITRLRDGILVDAKEVANPIKK